MDLVSRSERRLYSLPTRESGFNIKEPKDYEAEYAASLTACAPLENEDRANANLTQERIKNYQRSARLNTIQSRKTDFVESLRTEQRQIIEVASEKGASTWLTALHIKRYGFTLTKSKCRDGFCVRHNIEAINTLINCPCGEKFTLSHALHYARGGMHI